ncbi:MAG: RelA/SpoT domain-containing protein [Vicinamibacterales bacterium]|nr:RelA/SpoT domain-containing protein [Vicinamibacterales bacterium]
MASWVQRRHTKGEIDRAGEILVHWWVSSTVVEDATKPDVADAWIIAKNWRASHALPLLAFRMGLTSRAKRITANALIAQRLKRIPSILNKLAREPHMKLSQMQDLGGCRAIVDDVAAVDRLFNLYRGPQTLFDSEGSLKCYDYIRKPKPDGYRGLHVIGRYRPKVATNEPWSGHRIEIQLRTRLQHAYSTAVETVTTFTRHPLKFGGGPDEWRRFFSLTGAVFALREGTTPVEGTPSDPIELNRELRDVTKSLKVRQRLAGWAKAIRTFPRRNVSQFQWLLLVLNLTDNTIRVTGFSARAKAAKALDDIERLKSGDFDAVLVWVDSVRDLRAAYPNYYADTREFISALNQALRLP